MEYFWQGPGSLSHKGRIYIAGDIVEISKEDRQNYSEVRKLIDSGLLYREDPRKKKKK
jgi:hypothetical protein